MHERTVITFAVVLKDDLPIRMEVVSDPVGPRETLKPPIIETRKDRTMGGFEGRAVWVQVDEYKSLPDDTSDGLERVILHIEILDASHIRSALEVSAKVVGPRMVRALNRFFGAAASLDHPSPTVAADIVETIHLALAITDKDETFAINFMEKIVSGAGDVRCSAHTEPLLLKNLLGLLFIDFCGREEFSREALCPFR